MKAYYTTGSLNLLDLILRIENYKNYNNYTDELFSDSKSYDLIDSYIRNFKQTKLLVF